MGDAPTTQGLTVSADRVALLLREQPPEALYRFFRQRQHAELFLSGTIRLENLRRYHNTDDRGRRDDSEGTGFLQYHDLRSSVQWDLATNATTVLPPEWGPIHVTSLSATPMFVCCLCCPPLEALPRLAQQFGLYAVRLNEPTAFIEALSRAMVHCRGLVGPLECGFVVYKDVVDLKGPPTHEDHITSCSFCKSTKYAAEFEYRLLQRTALPTACDERARDNNHCEDDDRVATMPALIVTLPSAIPNAHLLTFDQAGPLQPTS